MIRFVRVLSWIDLLLLTQALPVNLATSWFILAIFAAAALVFFGAAIRGFSAVAS